MKKQTSVASKLTADLKRRYKRTLELSFVLSLSLLIVLFYSFKRFNTSAILDISYEPPTTVLDIPITKIEKTRPRPNLPKIPVEAEEDELLDDVTITDTDFDFTQSLGEAPVAPESELDIHEFWAVSEQPQLIKKSIPVYPDLAIKAGIEGQVVTKILIDEQGNAARVEILKSIPMLDEAAVTAARKCQFKPGKQRDRYVKVWMSVPFEFKLRTSR